MTKIPWGEKVVMFTINPDAASTTDVVRLADDLMDANAEIQRLRSQLAEVTEWQEKWDYLLTDEANQQLTDTIKTEPEKKIESK